MPPNKPLIWTLHDMANFTGGCCHDMACGKFTQRCGSCPQLGSQDESDLTRDVWLRKKTYYSSLNPERFHIVTTSRWLQRELGRSPLLSRFRNSVIPYGLDLQVTNHATGIFSRDLLGIPRQAKVIAFVSNGLVHLKGFHVLVDALVGLDASSGYFS